MSPEIKTAYPLLAESRGPIKEHLKEIDVKTVTGTYLHYVFASNYKHFKKVTLNFNISLNPESIDIETHKGIETRNWKISNLPPAEIEELIAFARELGISVEAENETEELARAILQHVNEGRSILVPAYREA